MDAPSPAGPAGDAGWQRRAPGAGEGRPPALLILPDAANQDLVAAGHAAIYYYVPDGPLLAWDAAGEPVLSLQLQLDRAPTPDETSVRPLIQAGRLGLDLTLAVPADRLPPPGAEDVLYRPLFAREATFDLVGPQGILAASVGPASGTGARVGLSVALAQAEALDVRGALDGEPSRLRARARIAYRAVGPDRAVRLTGSWARIHDFLAERLGAGRSLTQADLRRRFDELREAELLRLEIDGGGPTPALSADPGALFDTFLRVASVVLRRETPELEREDPANEYSLRGRPPELFALDVRETLAGTGRRELELAAPLDAVIGGVLDGKDWNRFVELMSPRGGGGGTAGGLGPAPRRLRAGRTTSRRPRGPGQTPVIELAATGGSVRSVAAALRPGPVVARPHVLAASDLASPIKAPVGPVKQWILDDLVLERPSGTGPRGLPVVDDPARPLWPDRVRPARRWYAPTFELLPPVPTEDPATAPFLFTVQRTGTTAAGKPALEGTVRITLRPGMSAETRAALATLGSAEAEAVPTGQLSAALAIPFVDEASGATRTHDLTGTVELTTDRVTVTVRMLNDWVRLCYGALAQPGFQPVPARLRLAYAYEAYVPVRAEDVKLTLGAKVARTAVVYSPADRPERVDEAVVDATRGSVLVPAGEVRLRRETAGPAAVSPREADLAPPEPGGGTMTLVAPRIGATAAMAARPLPSPALAQPALRPAADLAGLISRTRYAVQTVVREVVTDVLYDCRTLGAFYVESSAQGSVAIGCDDALQLGRTRLRQYEEIPDLAHSLYRVYRSLQQPGRFLVLPAAYRITRYDAGAAAKAYRPVIVVYASVDPSQPANNRVVIHAVLEPDIPPHLRRALQARLATLASTPVVEYPTEVESEPEYAWIVGGGGPLQVELRAVRMPDSFQVTLTTDPTGLRLLLDMLRTSGITGSVRFRFSDGSSLASTLGLDLRQITGPWRTGPLEVALAAGQASLTNRVERPIAVSDLALYRAGSGPDAIHVEATLGPGAAQAVPLANPADEAYAVYSMPAGDPIPVEEIRSFVEDVQTNVIFISLVNFANHDLQRLDVEARIQGVSGAYRVSIGSDPPVGSVDVVLPLTTYLDRRLLQFRVTKISTSGSTAVTPWIDWDLGVQGNVVSLQWETIA